MSRKTILHLAILLGITITFSWQVVVVAAPPDLESVSGTLAPGDFRAFQQVSPGKGWLLLGQNLYFMDMEGGTWRDITPDQSGQSTIEAVTFTDETHGWAVLFDDAGVPAPFTLAITTDAGYSWDVLPLALPDLDLASAPISSVSMGWRNDLHGWLVFKLASGSNFSLGLLFITLDGGSTWQARPIPLGEPAYFASEQVGWVAGGPAGDQLYRTQDGGLSWQTQQVQDADSGEAQFYYHLPFFDGDEQGLLPVVVADGQTLHADFYRTENGGDAWVLADSVPLETETIPDSDLPLALLGSDSFHMVVPGSDRIAIMEEGQIGILPGADDSLAGIVALSMSTLESGWAKWVQGECVVSETIQTQVNCTQEVRLLSTTDGGQYWTALVLPGTSQTSIRQVTVLPDKQPATGGLLGATSESYAGQGFDACEIRNLSQMQVWWTNSPYSAVNLYIGGSARACANSLLSAAYLADLNAQGWRFIPTWVGPQASCTGYYSRMSSDPAVAYTQGVAEAENALTVALNLGLTPPDKSGTIIYYDLETYNTADANCRAAANSFMSGWAAGLHAHGSLAGGYGSACSSGLGDWATLPNVMDAVWVAAWYGSAGTVSYRPTASVWGLPCLSDSLWPNHQRLHQYAGGHNETWGGLTINIDSNVLDGVLTEPAGRADSVLPSSPSILSPAEASILERNSDTWLSYKTSGDTCSLHVWGGGIDITTPNNCSLYHLGTLYGGSYSWQVTATNGFGSTVGPVWRFNIRPNGPGTLTVLSTYSTAVSLSWILSSDESANVDGYIVYANGAQVATLGRGVASYQVTNLPCSTTHTFYVTAVRQGVSSNPGNTVSAITTNCAPTDLTPVDNTDLPNLRPVLAWQAVAEATGYEVQISQNADFSSPVVNQAVTQTSFMPAVDLAANRGYYWRVRATGLFGKGDWSVSMRFRTANPPSIPNLALPATNSLTYDYTPRLAWNIVSVPVGTEFDHYHIQVSSDPIFRYLTVEEYLPGLNSLEYTFRVDLQPNTRYYWRVRAFNIAGQYSTWSPAWYFRTAIATPRQLIPLRNSFSTSQRPVLSWTRVAGASTFTLQISTSTEFSNLVTNVTLAGTSYVPPSDLPAGTALYWRIQANGTNGPSPWSRIWRFTTPAAPGVPGPEPTGDDPLAHPGLAFPADNSLPGSLRPRFDWEDINGASGYTLQLSTSEDFSNLIVDVAVTESSYIPASDLPADTALYWRVRMLGTNGPGLWSPVWYLMTPNPPGIPLPVAPENAALITDPAPRLDWSTVSIPDGTEFAQYHLQVASDAGFSVLILDEHVGDVEISEYLLDVDLLPNTRYYWRVQAINTDGQVSAWSYARSFRTSIAVPVLSTPLNNSLPSSRRPEFDWQDVAGASGYTLQVSTSADFDSLVLDVATLDSGYLAMSDLPASTPLYWRVQAMGTNGPSLWSSTWYFVPVLPAWYIPATIH